MCFLQVQQLVGAVEGTVLYNVTPSILMAEWHSLYTTALQYVTALQNSQTVLNENYFAALDPREHVQMDYPRFCWPGQKPSNCQ